MRRRVDRHRPVLLAVVVVAAALAHPVLEPASRAGAQTAEPLPGRPNVMVVLMDDMRAGEDTMAAMPNVLRWMRREGTEFPEGYVNTPLCCPERATIWSGRYMHNHGVIDNHSGAKLDTEWILPRYLREAGYTTALAGKFITDWNARNDPPQFDRWALFRGGYFDAYFNVDGESVRAPHSSEFVVDKGIEFLAAFEADDARPWYLHVAPHAPHESTTGTWDVPEPYASAPIPAWEPSPAVSEDTREAKADKPSWIRGREQPTEKSRTKHDGAMRTLLHFDAEFDRLMSALQANGELDDTLVIFTSDNGYSWGERGMTSKGVPYVESVKVPFMVRWPARFAAGAVDPRQVSGVDIMPTIFDAAGVHPTNLRYPLDGRSFLPERPGREELLLEWHYGHLGIPTWASLRTPQRQYIEWFEEDGSTVTFREYYDLAADPWQLQNLLADTDMANDPDVAALSAELAEARRCAGSAVPGGCP